MQQRMNTPQSRLLRKSSACMRESRGTSTICSSILFYTDGSRIHHLCCYPHCSRSGPGNPGSQSITTRARLIGLVKENDDTSSEELKEAKLLDKFDSTYAKLMVQKVTDLITLAEAAEAKTDTKTYKEQVTKSLQNLQSIQKQFQALNL